MVVIRLMGGLGNQMFQYAFAKKMYMQGKNVKLDVSYFDNIPINDTKRFYELAIFEEGIPLAEKKEVRKYYNTFELIKMKLKQRMPFINSAISYEDDLKAKIDMSNIENKYLIGYWQSEDYFYDIRQEILEDFTFDENLITVGTREILEKIKSVKLAVSIHIRGGDYLSTANKDTYGNICTEEYYKRACSYFIDKYSDVSFFVFSNDMKLAKNLLKPISNNIIFIDVNSERNGWEDMFLMSKCAHNIIANSTFSWWGAWLNQNNKKEVVVPARWSSDNHSEGIIPNDWIRV